MIDIVYLNGPITTIGNVKSGRTAKERPRLQFLHSSLGTISMVKGPF
jgi:hypothetical protein